MSKKVIPGGKLTNKVKIITDKDLQDMAGYKKPEATDKKNYIGIEIECFLPVQNFVLQQYIYHLKLTEYITIKGDGSIQPKSGYYPYEFALMTTEDKIFILINKFCTLLRELGGGVNQSCGLHVHLDMRNRDANKSFLNLLYSQPLLFSLQPKSRLSNSYCKPTLKKTLSESANYDGRSAINAAAFTKHKTIEVRVHAGTLNKYKITNWVKLLLKILNSETPHKYVRTLLEAKKIYNISPALDVYIKRRFKQFEVDKNNLYNVPEWR